MWTAPAPAALSPSSWPRGSTRPMSWRPARQTSCSATSPTSPAPSQRSPTAGEEAKPCLARARHRSCRARRGRWNETWHEERSRVAPRLGPPTYCAGLADPAPINRGAPLRVAPPARRGRLDRRADVPGPRPWPGGSARCGGRLRRGRAGWPAGRVDRDRGGCPDGVLQRDASRSPRARDGDRRRAPPGREVHAGARGRRARRPARLLAGAEIAPRAGRGPGPGASPQDDRVARPPRAAARGRDRLPGRGGVARLNASRGLRPANAREDVALGGEGRGSSEAGDLDAGVLEPVAAVDRREDRRDPLQQRRVRERPDVDGPEPHRAPELGDRVLRRLIAAEEEVAVDRLVGLGKLVGGNVMERGDHLRAGQKRLSLFGG